MPGRCRHGCTLNALARLIRVGSLLRLVVWRVFSATDQIIRRSRHGLQFKNRCQNVAERQQHTCIELSLAVSSIKPWWFVRHISASQSAQCLHVMQVSKYDCFPFNIPFFWVADYFYWLFMNLFIQCLRGQWNPFQSDPSGHGRGYEVGVLCTFVARGWFAVSDNRGKGMSHTERVSMSVACL